MNCISERSHAYWICSPTLRMIFANVSASLHLVMNFFWDGVFETFLGYSFQKISKADFWSNLIKLF